MKKYLENNRRLIMTQKKVPKNKQWRVIFNISCRKHPRLVALKNKNYWYVVLQNDTYYYDKPVQVKYETLCEGNLNECVNAIKNMSTSELDDITEMFKLFSCWRTRCSKSKKYCKELL